MSGSTAPSTSRTTGDPPNGLPLARFISTLDWAKGTHNGQTDGNPTPTCMACAPGGQDSTNEDVTGSLERLEGYLGFRVGHQDMLAFSPMKARNRSTVYVPAALLVDDGCLRCAIQVDENAGKRCLTLDVMKLGKAPVLNNSDTYFRLELAFPFVTMLFIKRKQKETANVPTNPSVVNSPLHMRFITMRDAVFELREKPSSLGVIATELKEDDTKGTFHHINEKPLEENRRQWERHDASTTELSTAFTNFMARGSVMTYPVCFPYHPLRPQTDGVSHGQRNHLSFVEAFEQQEVALDEAITGAVRIVSELTQPDMTGPDVLLTGEEVKARRTKLHGQRAVT